MISSNSNQPKRDRMDGTSECIDSHIQSHVQERSIIDDIPLADEGESEEETDACGQVDSNVFISPSSPLPSKKNSLVMFSRRSGSRNRGTGTALQQHKIDDSKPVDLTFSIHSFTEPIIRDRIRYHCHAYIFLVLYICVYVFVLFFLMLFSQSCCR